MIGESPKTYYSQHPVPQHVLGVEFKLVGGLTLKQFAYAGSSLILAYLTYISILPLIFKLPLAISITILGLSLAFVPVGERPMDEYLKNFLLAISSPTERVWVKEATTLDIFFEEFSLPAEAETAPSPLKNRSDLRRYLGKLKPEGARSTLDLKEEEYLKSLSTEFSLEAPPGVSPPKPSAPAAASYQPGRVEVKPPNTLASEVNFTTQEIISIPTSGKTRKFITPIKNIKAGRKLHSLPTVEGEIVMPVAGEIIVRSSGEEVPAASIGPLRTPEDLFKKAEETVTKLTEKIEEIKESGKLPAKTEPEIPETKPAEAQHPVKTPVPGDELPYDKGKLAGQLAVSFEEMERLKRQNEELIQQLNREKKAHGEVEKTTQELQNYRDRIRYLVEQNEGMSKEIRRIEEEYRKASSEVSSTKAEKEKTLKLLKEQQRRLEALSKEKAESVDEMVRLQKEMQALRSRADTLRLGSLSDGAPYSPPPTPSKKTSKPAPLIKDLPNIINGYVKDKKGSLIKNAVIIVKDQNDDVVRALKTNELGQFAITTPLPNGLYHVEASAPDTTFDIITVDLIGTAPEPVEFYGR